MCKEWVKTDCKKEHGKQKRVAEEEEEDQSWKDYVKRDLERAGTNGQDWNTTAEDRGKWKTLTMKVEEATK